MNNHSIRELSEEFYKKSNVLYEFIIKYNNYMQRSHDYGSGDLLSMTEMHLLTYISDKPGITVAELSNMWNRTKGAISQQVKKLESKKYIIKSKDPTNAKVVLLYATEAGDALSIKHKGYDIDTTMRTITKLLETCTVEELDNFFKVINEYINVLDLDNRFK